ncbi:ABC transporter permease [Aureimonas phyllosphaerae]|uniref:Polar amino acid transport system permease protein n=1 Tax=Aureimonas phyllosphaerae TaxID=1166078 RepID=A0A7W6BZ66_9HYPH|nr:ABC transporter permease [Aureimonas phyllosphaerae]MBB3935487.1 polar amino acid transport system permease protein [Aureimonas phyllosphaerae]MBB3959495.1 polar amino acid transport system permease protein [Aureimonas phyllosphaerae]SFF11252.1 amino acid ABC transporter membrane protein 1, PAAT family [Aureimonas phyllosphaerae]
MDYLSLLAYGDTGWGDEIARGVIVTVSLALATLPFGLLLGLGLALAKRGEDPGLRLSADIYTTLFRGLPELLTLFLVYYGGQNLLNAATGALGLGQWTLSSFVSGMVALGLVFAAYSSEVFLSAFRAIPDGQWEGAKALGLPHRRILWLVILPQLLRISLPGLSNVWLNLLKDTALVSVIGLADIMRETGVAARVTREPFFFFGFACVLYLVLTLVSAVGLRRLELWTKRGEVAR